MKTITLALVVSFSLFGCQPQPTESKTKAQSTISLPNDKITIINYWASWCKPCIKEIPELNALAAARDDIAVFGINFDGISGEQLAQEVARFDIQYAIADNAFGKSLGIPTPGVLPTTVLLTSDGTLVELLIGPQTAESLTHKIDAIAK